jgi:hypothetical protein
VDLSVDAMKIVERTESKAAPRSSCACCLRKTHVNEINRDYFGEIIAATIAVNKIRDGERE